MIQKYFCPITFLQSFYYLMKETFNIRKGQEIPFEDQMMTINPMRLSKLFNNDALDNACKEMTKMYKAILEEASL